MNHRQVSASKWKLSLSDGGDAFVTGIVLYRNLASIMPFQR